MSRIGEVAANSRIRRSPVRFLFLLAVLLLATFFLAVFIGAKGPIGSDDSDEMHYSELFDAILDKDSERLPYSTTAIVWAFRIPRVLLAGLVGASLACAGTAMQAVFRNPMADPFIIGVSSGAAIGASSAGLIGLTVVVGSFTKPVLAFACAIVTVFFVYRMGTIRGKVHVETLLLSGVAVAAFLGAIVSFLMYSAGQQFHELLLWLLGSFAEPRWSYVWMMLFPALAGVIIIFLYGRELNALLLGEETAHNLGANPEALKKLMLAVAAFVTAGAVAFTGIIGFVGLIVPHMMRILVGADHRVLVPAATLFGASFLIWADSLARTLLPGEELPVGVITAMCGGPFFLYLLRRSRTGSVIS